jgi:hypothetical protein
LAYCPRSSLPAKVLAWLAGRLAHLTPPRPPGQGGTPPLPLELRLDAVAAVLLDGLSYRRAGRMVGISKTEVGDSLDLLLPKLAALGYCQPDGSFVTTLGDVLERLAEMAEVGEVVCVDGLATRVQRPRGWGNQKVLYDSCRGLAKCSLPAAWPPSSTGDSAGWPRVASTGMRRSGTGGPRIGSLTSSGRSTGCRRGCARWSSRRSGIWPTPGRCVAGGGCCTGCEMSSAPLVCLGRWLHRVPA